MEPALNVLLVALVIAPIVAFFTLSLRMVPFIRRAAFRGVKPWACDYCMSVWSTTIFAIAWAALHVWPLVLFSWAVAMPLTMLLVRHLSQPVMNPPPLEDLDAHREFGSLAPAESDGSDHG